MCPNTAGQESNCIHHKEALSIYKLLYTFLYDEVKVTSMHLFFVVVVFAFMPILPLNYRNQG